jgi:hypothetical protein
MNFILGALSRENLSGVHGVDKPLDAVDSAVHDLEAGSNEAETNR